MANRMMQKLYLADAVEEDLMISNLVEKRADFKDILYGKEGAMTSTSKMNIPYTVSAEEFSDIPSFIRASIAQLVFKKYKDEANDVRMGKKTQTTYRYGMPISFTKTMVTNFSPEGFTWKKFNVMFVFGRDRSRNEEIVKGIIDGTNSLCDSSIVYEGKKTFMLLVVKVPVKQTGVVAENKASIDISFKCPINVTLLTSKPSTFEVGSVQKIEHHRIQLQNRYQSAQVAAKYSKGGHGRTRKLQSLEKFKELEKNTAKTISHTLTAEVIKVLVRNRIGTVSIICNEPKKNEELTEEGRKYEIRNFGYFQLKTMLETKCKQNGIVVEK